jgi:hypothetical protein
MKTIMNCSQQCVLRDKNNRIKVVNFRDLFLILISVFSLNLVFSQEDNSRLVRGENGSSSSAVTATESSKINPELKELEVKINFLLKEVRSQLRDGSNLLWFEENLQSSLRMKSAQACPSVHLIELVRGNEAFVVTPNMDKQELLYAIEFLNVSINGMLTK